MYNVLVHVIGLFNLLMQAVQQTSKFLDFQCNSCFVLNAVQFFLQVEILYLDMLVRILKKVIIIFHI